MIPTDLTQILAQQAMQSADDVSFDPTEAVSRYVGDPETLKCAATWTATLGATSFVWGPFGAGTGKWGLTQWS